MDFGPAWLHWLGLASVGCAVGFWNFIIPGVSAIYGAIKGKGGGGSSASAQGNGIDWGGLLSQYGPAAAALIGNATGGADLDPATAALLREQASQANQLTGQRLATFDELRNVLGGIRDTRNAQPFSFNFNNPGLLSNPSGGPLTAEFLQSLQASADAVPWTAGDQGYADELLRAASLLQGGSAGAAANLATLGEGRRTTANQQLAGSLANMVGSTQSESLTDEIIAELMGLGPTGATAAGGGGAGSGPVYGLTGGAGGLGQSGASGRGFSLASSEGERAGAPSQEDRGFSGQGMGFNFAGLLQKYIQGRGEGDEGDAARGEGAGSQPGAASGGSSIWDAVTQTVAQDNAARAGATAYDPFFAHPTSEFPEYALPESAPDLPGQGSFWSNLLKMIAS
jgi:hypothetical protein